MYFVKFYSLKDREIELRLKNTGILIMMVLKTKALDFMPLLCDDITCPSVCLNGSFVTTSHIICTESSLQSHFVAPCLCYQAVIVLQTVMLHDLQHTQTIHMSFVVK